MDLFRRYGNLLRPDGTNQLQRLLPGLAPDYIVPDERTFADLVQYAQKVAGEVRYFDLNGQSTGDWSALFEPLLGPGATNPSSTEELQLLLASRDDWPPHLVLFLSFLKLFQYLQQDLNQLTQKHLLHYYEQELGLLRRLPSPDDVHVLFEPEPDAPPTLLKAGTLLDAGKDETGRALVYAIQNDVVVSAASVGAMRRLVVERDLRGFRRFFAAEGFSAKEGASGNTFGARQVDVDPTQRFMTEAQLGFAVGAPVLQMAEGDRTVKLLAHLKLPSGAAPLITQGITSALQVSLTGAKGWLRADRFEATLLANGGLGMPALSITANIGDSAPAVVAIDPALHGAEFAGAHAMIRVLLQGVSGIYDAFDGMTVERVDLKVDVKGVRNLVAQNDEGMLDSKKSMPLFGSQPRIGSNFYIGSAEVFGKRLTALRLNLEWKAPPEDLFDYYRAYFDHISVDLQDVFYSYFCTNIDLLYERTFRTLRTNQSLFEAVPTEPRELDAESSAFDIAFAGVDYREQPDLAEPSAFDGTSRFGFLRLELRNPTRADLALYATEVPFEAFGHGVFSARYARQAIELSKHDGSGEKPKLPKEPYTPVLSALSLDYSATATLTPVDADGNAVAQYFVITPFGARLARAAGDARLVPAIDGSAVLMIGIQSFAPPGNVSLLFDIDIGTAMAAVTLASGEAEWTYLDAHDLWQPLGSGAILIDGTQGFQKPGIIALAVPADASATHRSMPTGLVWLRALIRRPPESAARTLAITTNGALARFEPGAAPLTDFESHLQTGISAGAISKLVQRNANIARILQPRTSFGGRGGEGNDDFIRRCSERLRHRNRAVVPGDVERLVLERFPEVFKVKCLPHTDENGKTRAGHAAVVVVPNLRRAGGTNPLEPRAGVVLLAQIAEYLDSSTTPFMKLHVIRPAFERLRVEAKVVFNRGFDPGYYAVVLNEDLCHFLSPWAFQDGEDILFGARIYRSEILAFIESRGYVDHIVGLRLYHHHDGVVSQGVGAMVIGLDFIVHPRPRPALAQMTIGDDFIVGRPLEAAQTTQAHAILVSHPAHLITPVARGAEICSGVTRLGIGYMTVGLDFNVGLGVTA